MKHVPNNRRPRRPNNRRNGGGGNQNVRNQTFESNGPEGRIRGTAQQVLEKYLVLARDSSSAGEHIQAEAFYQHAEHYFRLLNSDPNYQNRQQGDTRRPTPADNDGGFSDEDQDNANPNNEQQQGNQPQQNSGQNSGQNSAQDANQNNNQGNNQRNQPTQPEPAGLGDQPNVAAQTEGASSESTQNDASNEGRNNSGRGRSRGRGNQRTIPIESAESAAPSDASQTPVTEQPAPIQPAPAVEASVPTADPVTDPALAATPQESAPEVIAETAPEPAAPVKRGRGRPKRVVVEDAEAPVVKPEDAPAAE